MKRTLAVVLVALALTAGCARHGADAHPTGTPQSVPTMLIQARGVTVRLSVAVRQIAFRPFLPSAQIAAIALIPPLGGKDSRATHGLAIEYEQDGNALLLSQWPRAGFDISVGGIDLTDRPCAPVAYKPDGLLWTTRSGRVMTLQPDGTVAPSRIAREAARLLRTGACR